jgi:hypothetical protein
MFKEKDPFKKLYSNILRNGVLQDENGEWTKIASSNNRKKIQEKQWDPPKILISPIEIENKWHEQDGKCHWTGMELDLGLLFDDYENYYPMHPLAPSVDRINSYGDYEYENIVICARMMNLGRTTYDFDKFYDVMIKVTESLISTKTSPEYIKKHFLEKTQRENMQKQIESVKKPEITWDDVFFINPKLKETVKITT